MWAHRLVARACTVSVACGCAILSRAGVSSCRVSMQIEPQVQLCGDVTPTTPGVGNLLTTYEIPNAWEGHRLQALATLTCGGGVGDRLANQRKLSQTPWTTMTSSPDAPHTAQHTLVPAPIAARDAARDAEDVANRAQRGAQVDTGSRGVEACRHGDRAVWRGSTGRQRGIGERNTDAPLQSGNVQNLQYLKKRMDLHGQIVAAGYIECQPTGNFSVEVWRRRILGMGAKFLFEENVLNNSPREIIMIGIIEIIERTEVL
ncbi:hypothetical protein BD779DRAFT_1469787 [Infundibulicybe gibba]|nr:hypothetical protein BD779DRAFT_1469787 [Infundibulicybe gibba]